MPDKKEREAWEVQAEIQAAAKLRMERADREQRKLHEQIDNAIQKLRGAILSAPPPCALPRPNEHVIFAIVHCVLPTLVDAYGPDADYVEAFAQALRALHTKWARGLAAAAQKVDFESLDGIPDDNPRGRMTLAWWLSTCDKVGPYRSMYDASMADMHLVLAATKTMLGATTTPDDEKCFVKDLVDEWRSVTDMLYAVNDADVACKWSSKS